MRAIRGARLGPWCGWDGVVEGGLVTGRGDACRVWGWIPHEMVFLKDEGTLLCLAGWVIRFWMG
jgi:hypothetical protein